MIVSFHNGEKREYSDGLTVYEILKRESEQSAKVAVAAKIDGVVSDLSVVPNSDFELSYVTLKDGDGMKVYRHTVSHILAHAVKTVFPTSKCAGGDDTESGFYYDFDFNTPITEDDLVKIENEMRAIIRADLPIERFNLSLKDASKLMKGFSEPYIVQDIADCGQKEISFCKQGDFTDVCAEVHLRSTGKIKAFKLTSITGAYWKGNASNKMLTRISGIAFEKKFELENYLKKLNEAKKNTHNVLGRKLGYFTDSPEIGRGLPIILPKGAQVIRALRDFIETEEVLRGFNPICTPLMAKSEFLKNTGKVGDRFTVGDDRKSKDAYALRRNAMPFVLTAYSERQRSYKDLPLKYCETAVSFENVPYGKTHGLTRLRQFTVSDEYFIFKNSDAEAVVAEAVDFISYVLKTVGFYETVSVSVSRLGENRCSRYYGTSKEWNQATALYKKVLVEKGIGFFDDVESYSPFGPGIDFYATDVFGKKILLSSIRYDFQSAKRLKLQYTDCDGEKRTPSVIRANVLGCYERALALLVEKSEGFIPVRFAPVQVAVLSVSDKYADYAAAVARGLLKSGIRVKTDVSNGRISKKIRNAFGEFIPYIAVVGEKENNNGTVSLRDCLNNESVELTLEEVVKTIKKEY